MFALKSAPASWAIKDWSSFAHTPYKVCYYRGMKSIEGQISRVLPAAQVVVDQISGCIALVQSGRVDMLVSNDGGVAVATALNAMAANAPALKVIGRTGHNRMPPYINVRHKALLPKLEAAIRDMRNEGVIARMLDERRKDASAPAKPDN